MKETAKLKLASRIDQLKNAIAFRLVELHEKKDPVFFAKFGVFGRPKCLEDALFHISYLSQSIAVSRPSLFVHYIEWARNMLNNRGIKEDDLRLHLELLQLVLQEQLNADEAKIAVEYVQKALHTFGLPSPVPKSFLNPESQFGKLATEYLRLLLARERDKAIKLILDEVKRGTSIKDIFLQVFEVCQKEIGRLWQMNQLTVADEHYCTAATQLVISQLYPYVFTGSKGNKVLVAACPQGELHELGLRILTDFFEISGWNTYFVGANTPEDSLIRFLKERKPSALAISATIGLHLDQVGNLVSTVRQQPELQNTKILVGGLPFTLVTDLWKRVGADGFAPNAQDAFELATRLVDN